MNRESLNLFFERLFILTDESDSARADIIEIASESEDATQFLQEWLWSVGVGLDQALEIKLAFGFTYAELGELFGLSSREVGQQLRARRLKELGPYPRVDQGDFSVEEGGLSCFMLEQHLSQWLDCEWEDLSLLPKIKAHLRLCPACKGRLQSYRQFHQSLLDRFPSVSPVSETEWNRVLEESRVARRKKLLKWGLILFAMLFVLAIFVWIIRQQPETMPNIYEIPESSD